MASPENYEVFFVIDYFNRQNEKFCGFIAQVLNYRFFSLSFDNINTELTTTPHRLQLYCGSFYIPDFKKLKPSVSYCYNYTSRDQKCQLCAHLKIPLIFNV